MEERIDKKIVNEYVERFGVESVEKLKGMSEWIGIESEELKKKVYQRVYYLQSKKGDVIKNGAPQKFYTKQPLKYFELTLVGLIALFLMNESSKFYREYGFSDLYSIVLPLMVELSIIYLAMEKTLRAKILALVLVVFNIVSFSFYSVSDYLVKSSDMRLNISQSEILKSEYDEQVSQRDKFNALYSRAIKARLITKANREYLPKIESANIEIKRLSGEIRGLKGSDREITALLVGCISLIVLKFVFQMVVLFALPKIKRSVSVLK